jgi:4-hydroxy-tetrahydrodipicolinate synthase
MDILKQLQGIIGVVNTPFTEENRIDVKSLQRYAINSLNQGVVGFLISAMAAEVNKISFEERKQIARTIIETIQKKVPVIGGTTADSQTERIKIARMLIDAGSDGILVNIPFQAEDKFREEIGEIKCFKCLKIEVVPAGVKYSEVLTATNGKLHVSGGWAGTQMIEALDRGVHAFMPTILHDVYNTIYQLHCAGKREKAKKLFYRLTPILAFSHQHLDISFHFNKQLLYQQGIFSTPKVRNPILEFDKFHENIANELIEEAINLTKNLSHYE